MATGGPLAAYLMQRSVEDNVTGKTIASARHSIGNAPTSAAVSSHLQSIHVRRPADASSALSGDESDDSVLNEEEEQLLDSLVSKRHSSAASPHLLAAAKASDAGKALLQRAGYVDIYTPALVGALVPSNTPENVVSGYTAHNGGIGTVAQTPKGRPPETETTRTPPTCQATIASHRSSVCIFVCKHTYVYTDL